MTARALFAAVLFTGMALVAPATADSVVSASADEAWAEFGYLVEFSRDAPGELAWRRTANDQRSPREKDAIHNWLVRAERQRLYRERGLEFWRRYPQDPRRLEWLVKTMETPPRYWKDPLPSVTAEYREHAQAEKQQRKPLEITTGVDVRAQALWEDAYQKELRPAFFASSQTSPQQRERLRWYELRKLSRENLEKVGRRQAVDVPAYLLAVIEYAAEPAADDPIARTQIGYVFHCITAMGPEGAALEAQAIAAFKASPNPEAKKFGMGREQVARLKGQPLQLSMTGFDGKALDVAHQRGKVVLLDIWSLSCSSCIEAMPRVRKMYDKYRERGFEVIGVCLMVDEAKEKQKARKVLDDTGAAAWANGLLAGPDYFAFSDRYAVKAVPVTWLLDRDGRLVTTDVEGSKLEAELQRLL